YFLISKLCKDIKIEEVYPEFKNLFLSSKAGKKDEIDYLRTFYDEVVSFLEHYIFLKFNKDVDNYSNTIKECGFRLNYLTIETPFPYLMQVLEQYKQSAIDENEIIKIFRIIESYLARRIICNIPTTGLNKLFSGLHKEIKNLLQQYPDQKYYDILAYVITNKWGGLRMPKTAEIKYAVENNPIYTQRNNYIYFILSSIDDRSKESNLLRQISSGEIELTIEHIMPKSLNNSWKESLGEEYEDVHKKYLHTLPNLTLTGYNSKYSNSDFQAKKSMANGFSESPLVINKFIKNMESWKRESLEIRSEWWVNQIDELWPIPESLFKPDTKEKELYLMEDNDFSNSKIKDIIILGDSYNCNKWTLAMEIILSKFFLLEDQLYDFIVSDSYLSKYIKAEDNGFRRSSTIEGTRYFYETNLNVNKKRDIIVRLADYLGLEKTDIKVILAD
ncbi:TPA: HNH endonuclease, partial [Legionella pneumophila]|nr:HNH endonuclease [Legionella pneumophila]